MGQRAEGVLTPQRAPKALTIKKSINYVANGGAALSNLVTFVNGNSTLFGLDQDTSEGFSGVITKIATGIQGLILGIDAFYKNNIIPCLGFILEIPIAIFSSDYNLWLMRGISQGLGQFQAILDRKELLLKDENPKLFKKEKIDKAKDEKEYTVEEGSEKEKPPTLREKIDGDPGYKEYKIIKNNKSYISDLFKVMDMWEIFKTNLKESWKITKGIFSNYKNLGDLPHGLFLASVSQILGGGLALFGLPSVGAPLRNFAGLGVDIAMLTDKKSHKKVNSLLFWGGCVWMIAAIADEAKRIPIIGDAINSLTNLAMFSDRLASLIYTHDNLKIQSHHATHHHDDPADVAIRESNKDILKTCKEQYYSSAA